jgi:hypothetical protein
MPPGDRHKVTASMKDMGYIGLEQMFEIKEQALMQMLPTGKMLR